MTSDLTVAAEFVQSEFVGFIDEAHGTAGTAALRHVLRAVISTFNNVEPESLSDPLVIFAPVQDIEDLPGEQRVVEDYSDLQYHREGWLVIEVIADGTARVWSGMEPDVEMLSYTSVVYVYEDGADHLLAKGRRHTAPRTAGLGSWFARPVFTDLRKALLEYRSNKARTCRCHTLKRIWREEARLILKSKPEGRMRDSLEDHLVSSLRDVDVEVRPEFVVDESHPVDIRVMFHFQNRAALIEIKWMGLSVGDGGETTQYSCARARTGAGQLAKYLDRNRERAGTVITKGYLVVIDGRRRGLRTDSTSTTAANGMYYADKEVKYSPEFHNTRRDFAAPIRMFVEPASVDS